MKFCSHVDLNTMGRETDTVKTCETCGKLVPVPLSPAGVEKTLVELLPRAAADTVTEFDRDVWAVYGHLLISALREKFQRSWY